MKTFLTPDPIVVEVRNASGLVSVDLTDTTTTEVEVIGMQGTGVAFIDDLMSAFRRDQSETPSVDLEDDIRIDLRVQEHGTVLIVDTDPARHNWRGGFRVHITAPVGSGIRAQTQSADVQLTGRADRLDVRTASGDVQADVVERGSLVQTASGDVRITEIAADAEIRTASGDVSVRRSGGSLSVHSTSGDVRIERPDSDLFVRSVSGDIRVHDAIDGVLQATAVSGDVEIGVHRGTAAKIDLATLSGDTRNDFEVHDEPVGAFAARPNGTDRRDGVRVVDAPAETVADAPAPAAATGTDSESGGGADPVGSPVGTVTTEKDRTASTDDDAEPSFEERAAEELAAPADGGRLEIIVRTTSGDINLRRSTVAA